MLKEFLSTIAQNGGFKSFFGGGLQGGRGIPSQGGFGQIFNSIQGGIPFGVGGGFPMGAGFPAGGGTPFGGGTQFGGLSQPGLIGNGALQAFQGAQNQFGNYSPEPTKAIRHQALAPGAVLVGPQSQPPSSQATSGFGLQGFAGQTNPFNGGGVGGYGGQTNPFNGGGVGGFGQSYFPQYAGPGILGGLGRFQFLLSPIITLVGMVKSVFGFRKQIGSIQPVTIDPNITGYNQSIAYLNDSYADSGFDEPRPFNGGIPNDLDPNESGNSSYF